MTDTKFGYWPYKQDYKTAGDRRRFIFYANEKNLQFETASLAKQYDIVYLTVGCDIHQWIQYKKKYPSTKIIFECIDSYSLEGFNLFSFLRGGVRFLKGRESKLYLNYKKALINMYRVADAVVCSTPIQKEYITRYNKNVHISLDYFEADIAHTKKQYETGKKLKLVWEGQSYTVNNLLAIKEVFRTLTDKVELHIITDSSIVFPFEIFNKKTSDIVSKIPCTVFFHPWKINDFSKHITDADLAIIPIKNNDKLYWNKPENKLLLLWQMGVPVLTSNTPAYSRVMNEAGIAGLCSSDNDWITKIEEFIKMNETQREAQAFKATNFLATHHSKEIILQKWDKIFQSVSPQPVSRALKV
ncbi:MAG TPA: hypothetical protein PKU77_01330 [Ferruginibacter sp.]|nr:hypothetical protein [Ferruginibacter sp.]